MTKELKILRLLGFPVRLLWVVFIFLVVWPALAAFELTKSLFTLEIEERGLFDIKGSATHIWETFLWPKE